jgi:hypothetical protein
MWSAIKQNLPDFPSAVLTAFDLAGQPFSLRCYPRPDEQLQALSFTFYPGLEIQEGQACMLFHKHDERLWNLKSFVVQGIILRDESGWRLQPERFIPGMGIGGLSSYVSIVIQGRRNTSRYLKKRGLRRPKVAWDDLADMMAQANRE